MNKEHKTSTILEFFVVFIASCIIVAFYFSTIGVGVIKESRFFLAGDYEYYYIIKSMLAEGKSFLRVFLEMTKDALNFRFRPIYYFEAILGLKLFGLNWYAFFILRGIICALSISVLYTFAREMSSDRIPSAAFALLPFLCSECDIVFDICAENVVPLLVTGILFLAITKSICGKDNKINWKIVFFISYVVFALSYESFVVQLPFVILFYVLMLQRKNKKSILETVRSNKFEIVFMLVTMVAVFAFIGYKLIVGWDEFSNETPMTASVILSRFFCSLLNNCTILICLFVAIFFEVIVLVILKRGEKKELRYTLLYLVMLFLCYFTNLLVHTKTTNGMATRRYIVFSVLPLGFVIFILLYNQLKEHISFKVFTAIFLLFIVRHWAETCVAAGEQFFVWSKEENALVEEMISISDKSDIIWIYTEDHELSNTDIGYQMIMENSGYDYCYILYDGYLIDVYENKNNPLISIPDEWRNCQKSMIYRYFNYNPVQMSRKDITEVDIIVESESTKGYINDLIGIDVIQNSYMPHRIGQYTLLKKKTD